MDKQQMVLVEWENEVPFHYNYDEDLEYILNKFCDEMEESFKVIGRYSKNTSEGIRMVQKNAHMFLEVKKSQTILYIPTECLDMTVLIDIIDRKYGELILLM